MPNLLDFVRDVALRGGVAADSQELLELLQRPDLAAAAQVNVPDAVAAAAAGLMSVQAAKSNADVQSHFRQAHFSAIDGKLAAALDAAGDLLTTEQRAELTAERSTPARTEKALKMLLDAKPARTGDKALQDEIKRLNDTARAKEEGYAAALATEKQHLTDYQRNQQFESATAQIKWADTYQESVRPDLAKLLIGKKLDEIGATAVLVGGKLVLKQKADPSLDFYQDNKTVSFADLVQRTAAENKLIAVTPAPTGAGNPATPYVPPVQQNQGATRNAAPAFQAAQDSSMRDALAGMKID